jgi:methyltransferase (TIGR00027 family)
MRQVSDPQDQASQQGATMTEIKNVTGTAFIVAEFRADENSAAEPLFRDEIVPLFLDDATRKAADGFSAAFPPIKQMIKLRTRYLDDRLDEQLRRGFRQVAVLGAGFDTRSVRKQTAGVNYFEIDDPGTLNFKKAQLDVNNIRAGPIFIPGNYVSDDLNALLESNGFDFSLPTHFIWEGNTMYLTEDSVRHVMTNIAQRVERFTLAFDYMTPEVITKTTGDPAIRLSSSTLSPWELPGTSGSATWRNSRGRWACRSSRTGRRGICPGTTGRTELSTHPFTVIIPCAHWRGRGRTSRDL